MAAPPVRRILDRLPAVRHRRAELSVAAYCSAFGVPVDADEPDRDADEHDR